MKIHEYLAKEILRRYGVATPRGKVTEDPEVRRICEELGRAQGKPVVMASSQGGMDIEEVAAKDPKAIFRQVVEPAAKRARWACGRQPRALS